MAKKSLKGKIGKGTLPTRRYKVCLRADLFAEIERLNDELAELQQQFDSDDRLAKVPRAREIASQIEAIREQMKEHTEEFVLSALRKPEWNEIRLLHPPRDGEEIDKSVGVNMDTFCSEALRASIVSHDIDDEDWDELLAALTDRQYEDMVDIVWVLNRGSVSIPFSPAASMILQRDSTQRRPNGSGSPANASTGGKPAKSRRSSTTSADASSS